MMISHAERWQLFEILMKFHFAFHPAMRSNKERQMLCQSPSHFTFHQKTTPEVGINVDKISLALSNFINFLSKNKLRLAADDGVRMLFIFFSVKFTPKAIKMLNWMRINVVSLWDVFSASFYRFWSWGNSQWGAHSKVLKWVRLKNKPTSESWEFFF